MSSWDPRAYGRFQAERRRPVDDLIARLPRSDYASIADLGCGGGQSTEPLAERFPAASIRGYDNSEPMLASARQRLPEITFVGGDITDWSDPSAELVFSNAALQWVQDHVSVMARIASQLPAGGCLAAQFPDNLEEPSHALMREIAALPPFQEKWTAHSAARQEIGEFSTYDAALAPYCSHIDIWRTVYVHRLESPDAIVSWVEGSGLRPYLEPLDAQERQDYLHLYGEAIAKAYPRQPSGAVLLPFPRLFVVAARS
jgi:trans-aconitate 2-methyltransferase